MIDLFNEQRKIFQKNLVEKVALYDYRYCRYHINYSISLIFVEEKTDLSNIKSYLRKSDEYIKLNSHLYTLFLDCTDDEKGIKSSNDILCEIQAQFFSKHVYMSVVTASNYKDSFQMVHDLFDLIEYGIHHNMNNLLIDSSQPILNN